MSSSVICGIIFVVTIAGISLYSKSECKLNGVKTIIVSLVSVASYLFVTGCITRIFWGHISANAICTFMLLLAVAFWLAIYNKKKIQHLFWRASDVIGLMLIVVFAIAVSIHVFSSELEIQYCNLVGSEQFLTVMRFLRNGTDAVNISFTTYMEALFIELLTPIFPGIESYKAFIIAEIFLRILEVCMFYVVVLTISDRKIVRYAAPVLSICYFFGYPTLSLLYGNYGYWNAGALLFLFMIYALLVLEKQNDMRGYAIGLLLLACIVNLIGAQFYASLNIIAVMLALLVICIGKRKDFTNIKVKYSCFGVVIAGIAAAGLIFYREWFVTQSDMTAGSIAIGELITDGIYRSMYGDLLFFIPAFIFVISYVFLRKNYSKVIGIVSVSMLAVTIVLYVLWYNSLVETGYYFLNYYNLWLLGWLLVAMALEIAADTKQMPVFLSYAGMMIALGVLVFSNYDYKMWHRNPNYNQPGITSNFFSLYRQNLNGMLTDYADYRIPDGILEAFEYMMEEEKTAKTVIVTSDEAIQNWYDAFTAADSTDYRMDQNEFPDVVKMLESDGIDAVTIIKDSEDYRNYQTYYKRCQILFENEETVVYTYAGKTWTDIQGMGVNYSEDRMKLFEYARDNYGNETVPLMADRTAYLDFVMYQNIFGTNLKEFYTWKYSPVDNLNNLNAHGVQYIILLNDDAYYQATKDYFDRQEVVFENEAGRVLKCAGDEWSTQY